MSRTRQRHRDGDGGAFNIQNRPPAKHLPSAFTALFEEYDRISIDLAESRKNASRWRATLEADEFAAIKADGAAAGLAAREGRTPENPTAHIDEVRGRLRQATDAIPALETALELIRRDLGAVRAEVKAEDKKHTRLADSHQKLVRAADALAVAVAEYTAELARHEWIHDHQPWDSSAQLTLAQLPGINGLVDVRYAQVAAASLIHAIKDL